MSIEQDQEIIDGLIQWANQQSNVRAVLLTSSRAIPNSSSDIFSDYDVILVVGDILSFHESRAWLDAFGPVLVLYRDPLESYDGNPKTAYVVQYENGLKIDFTLWSVEILQQVVAKPKLPDEFDAGYLVLLDKDDLTNGLKPPTYTAYIPTPPTENEYQEFVEVFFLEAIYVAKFLWREEIVAAKHILDHFMKHEHLLPMLEWHIEIDHQWSVKPGLYGQRLKEWLRPDLWEELETTYTGFGLEENWEAMYTTVSLFRKVAIEVGKSLGYEYPQDIDLRTINYLQKVRRLDRKAKGFG
ncbi:MAG: aminoglycoside 6-adenylyltransferase [Chloroflexi bacterium]|nr:aminoglycoside 6-adenylyltransferase [Chloroflexota bacterium]MBU1662281.1 aminoglycoside 6-adenylyltransferase [Chloroflexota bacterium]